MRLGQFADAAIHAVHAHDAASLARLFALDAPPAHALLRSVQDTRAKASTPPPPWKRSGFLAGPWEEMANAHLAAIVHLSMLSDPRTARLAPYAAAHLPSLDAEGKTEADRLADAYAEQSTVVSAFLRHFSTLEAWALPLLYTLLRDLRALALRTDASLLRSGASRAGKLEDCARTLNKAFGACVADRTPEVEKSRKWGTYFVVGLIFKTYFKLKSISLCKNILRAISVADMPPLDQFPRAHVVTFRYYLGVLAFLNEEYAKAETELTFALNNCHRGATRNLELILTYLIPVRLLRGSTPSSTLLTPFPSLLTLYSPFLTACAHGDVRAYDTALSSRTAEIRLVRAGTYLAIERAREACLRGLFRRVWLAREKSTRMNIDDFWNALRWVGVDVAVEEAEWYVATMIYRGYMRGYISHERQVVVLSAKDPFPKLGTFVIQQ